jgi:hypothetical protein
MDQPGWIGFLTLATSGKGMSCLPRGILGLIE